VLAVHLLTGKETAVVEQPTQDVQVSTDEPRDFCAILIEINKGESHRELSEALADLVAAVEITGKPGSLSYSLKVQPHQGNSAIVTVTDEIKRKIPEGDRRTSIFFVDQTHSLVRNDPHQVSLFDAMTGDR
jgi:hypothetical protein